MDGSAGGDSGGSGRPPIDWRPPAELPSPLPWPPQAVDTRPRAPEPPSTPARRALEIVAWIVGIAGVLFFGRLFPVLTGSRTVTAGEAGALAGSITAAVLIGVLASWLVVRIRRRGRVLSPWILVVAILVLLASLGRQPGAGAPAASGLPIEAYLKVGAPYALTAASPEQVAGLAELQAHFQARAAEARGIQLNGEDVGFLVVGDAGVRDPETFRREMLDGMVKTQGAAAEAAVLSGHDVIEASASGVSILAWVEAPHLLLVYAADRETARAITASIIAAYD